MQIAPASVAPPVTVELAQKGSVLRWTLPAVLLALEYLALSVSFDLPLEGAMLPLAEVIRIAVPVVLCAGLAGWMLLREASAGSVRPHVELPPWRPARPMSLQLACFAGAYVVAGTLFGDGAAGSPRALFGWLLLIGVSVVAAVATAAPLGWFVGLAGKRWRDALLAIASGFAAWGAAALAERTWSVLSSATLRGVAALLAAAPGQVVVYPEHRIVGLDQFVVEIAPICSGVNGIGIVLVFQGLWLALGRDRLVLRRALILLPLGAAAAFAANIIRVSGLILLGAAGHRALALGGFHSHAGWFLFGGIALGTVALADRVGWFRRAELVRSCRAGLSPAGAALIAPFLAALVVALVTSAGAGDNLDRAYALRAVAAIAVLWAVRRDLPAPRLSWSPEALAMGLMVGITWVAWPGSTAAGTVEQLQGLPSLERGLWIATRIAVSCAVIPVVEELAFRGFLLPWLVSPSFENLSPRRYTAAAVVLSSVAFGVIHGNWILGTLSGVAFAVARQRRGRLSDAIVAHVVANVCVAGAVLALGRWDLWP